MKWALLGLAAVVVVGVIILLTFSFAPTSTVSDTEVPEVSETAEPSKAEMDALGTAMDQFWLEEKAAVFPHDAIIVEHMLDTGILAPELFSSRDKIDRMIETLVKAQAELDDPLSGVDQIRDNVNNRIRHETDVPDYVTDYIIEHTLTVTSDPELRRLSERQYEKGREVYAAYEAFYRLHRNNFDDFEVVPGIIDDWEIRYSANPLEMAALESRWVIDDAEVAHQAASNAFFERLDTLERLNTR